MFDYRNSQFWELYRNTPAWEFSRFLALSEKGQPSPAATGEMDGTPLERNLAHAEASARWTREFLASL